MLGKVSFVVLRLIHLLRNPRAAIDLASIMVGVIVVALVAGAVGATVFAVIPWAQNQAARSDLDAVKQAESVAKLPDPSRPARGKYLPKARDLTVAGADPINLVSEQLMPDKISISVGVGTGNTCYIGVSRSQTGDFFWLDSLTPAVHDWKTDKASACDAGLDALIGDFPALGTPEPFTVLAADTRSAPVGDWKLTAATPDGQKLAAALNNGPIHTSVDGGTTWVARTDSGSAAWTALAMSTDGKTILAAASGISPRLSKNSGKTWSDVAGAGTLAWTAATASDGQHLMVFASDGPSVRSDDGGVTWVPDKPRDYSDTAVSADGAVTLAASDGGYLYTSNIAGATWVERQSAGQRAWKAVAVSPDGVNMVAAPTTGYLYTSTNKGKDWTEATVAGSHTWTEVTSNSGGVFHAFASGEPAFTSKDAGATWVQDTPRDYKLTALGGTVFLASAANGYLYTSSTTGGAVVELTSAGNRSWSALAVSADGTTMYASAAGGDVLKSVNGGATWAVTGAGQKSWTSLSTNTNGSTVMGTVNAGYAYRSTDFGSSWSQTTAGAAVVQPWTASSMSVNGQVIILSASGKKPFVSTDSGVTWTQNAPSTASRAIVSADGTKFFYHGGASDTSIYISGDGGLTWTKSAGVGDPNIQLATNADGSVITWVATGMSSTEYPHQAAVTGTVMGGMTNITTAMTKSWSFIAGAADGSFVASSSTYTGTTGQLYVRAGASAPVRMFGTGSAGISYADSSRDGSVIFAGVGSLGLVSTDGGGTWVRRVPASVKPAVSGDGSKLFYYGGASDTYMYVSTDNGATWTQSPGTGASSAVLSSNLDGSVLTYVPSGNTGSNPLKQSTVTGTVWGGWSTITTTSGVSWSSIDSADDGSLVASTSTYNASTGMLFVRTGPTAGVRSVGSYTAGISYAASSQDGQTLFSAGSIGYVSTDSGRTWTKRIAYAGAIAVSGDGSKLFYFGGASDSYVYFSVDSGVTWVKSGGTGDSSDRISTNLDGTLVMVVEKGSSSSNYIRQSTVSSSAWGGWSNVLGYSVPYGASVTAFDNGGFIASFGSGGVFVGQLAIRNDAAAPVKVVGTQKTGWSSVGISEDGTLIAAVLGGTLQVSVDGGSTWAPSGAASSVAVSGDGSKIVVLRSGYLYVSDDKGANWVKSVSTAPTNASLSLSRDGSKVLITQTGNSSATVTTATLSGTTWAASVGTGTGTRQWTAGALSDDGKTATVVSTAQIWGMTSGAAWAQRTGDASRVAVAIAGGTPTIQFTAVSGQPILKSVDSGATWSATTSAGNLWTGLAVSDDGTKIAAVSSDGHLATSVDGGAHWNDPGEPGAWKAVTVSGDGSRIVAVSAAAAPAGVIKVLNWNR